MFKEGQTVFYGIVVDELGNHLLITRTNFVELVGNDSVLLEDGVIKSLDEVFDTMLGVCWLYTIKLGYPKEDIGL